MDNTGFFEETPKSRSMMRLMCFISLFASIGFGCMTILVPEANSEIGLWITGGFLIGAFAPKAVQKFAEKWPGA